MKKGLHPENYRPVVFKDMSNGDMFLSRSTCKTNDTVMFEGQEYPVVKLEISNTSHPFYTGKAKLVDTAQVGGHRRSRGQVHEPLRKDPQVIGFALGLAKKFTGRCVINHGTSSLYPHIVPNK